MWTQFTCKAQPGLSHTQMGGRGLPGGDGCPLRGTGFLSGHWKSCKTEGGHGGTDGHAQSHPLSLPWHVKRISKWGVGCPGTTTTLSVPMCGRGTCRQTHTRGPRVGVHGAPQGSLT